MGLKKPSKETIAALSSAIFGVISVLILVFALFSMAIAVNGEGRLDVFLFFLYLSLALSRGYLAAYMFQQHKKLCLPVIKNLVFVLLFIAGAVLSFVLPLSGGLFSILGVLYFAAIVVNKVCLIVEKRKLGSIIVNSFLGLLGIFAMALLFITSGAEELATSILVFLLLIVVIISLFEVLGFAFSKIQLKGLLKIIRKTYVIEILYGLVILLISFSFYFSVMEDGFNSFWDALWYSFAIITTIGLGDFTVTTAIGRVLTVILGIYGIIVTASITSVIVNYYNEVKSEHSESSEEQKAEEPTEEVTPEDTPKE